MNLFIIPLQRSTINGLKKDFESFFLGMSNFDTCQNPKLYF